jgi:VIT1/CCC1 family predicted Fe2+/Mn2+ transporter
MIATICALVGATRRRKIDSAGNGRPSLHVVPRGPRATAQHYIRDLVYGANDGIITTFAVVAGVAGGSLSTRAVLIVGVANLLADGLSMGAGNYLGIRAEEGSRELQGLPEAEANPARHGLATFVAFVAAGVLPLAPYFASATPHVLFATSVGVTLAGLFGVGAARSVFSQESWLVTGLEMLGLGMVVALVAFGAGALAASLASALA